MSLLLSLLNQAFFEAWASLYLDTFCVYVCVCQSVFQGGRRVYRSPSFMSFPLNRFPLCRLSLCVCICACVGRCVGVFMAPVRLSTPLHLPPSLPSSLSLSFLLNLSFHPVQTVCRCCPPLPLHHACRNEIKP